MSLIIVTTGMHRSGTSLVSSLLQEAGVHVGEQLLAPNVANPHGFFEDVDFYEFHEELLRDRGQSYLYVDNAFAFEPTAADLERASQLIAERAHRPCWGWKDPRTALFLDFWHQQLPDARYLFVYRHPLAVLLSLVRRGEFEGSPNLSAGLAAWQVYNDRLRAFYNEHMDRCLLVHIDSLVGEFPRFCELLRHKLGMGLELAEGAFDRIFHAGDLQQFSQSRELSQVFAKLCPQQSELYEDFNRCADLPSAAGQKETSASESLAALASFAHALPGPVHPAQAHGLLLTIASLLAPEPTAAMLDQFQKNAKGTQQKIDTLWVYAHQLERTKELQSGRLDEQERQLQKRNREVSLQAAHIQSLLTELAR